MFGRTKKVGLLVCFWFIVLGCSVSAQEELTDVTAEIYNQMVEFLSLPGNTESFVNVIGLEFGEIFLLNPENQNWETCVGTEPIVSGNPRGMGGGGFALSIPGAVDLDGVDLDLENQGLLVGIQEMHDDLMNVVDSELMPNLENFGNNVAILIVDDFKDDFFTFDDDTKETLFGELLDIYSADSNKVQRRQNTDDLITFLENNGNFSHGALVLEHTLSLVPQSLFNGPFETVPGRFEFELKTEPFTILAVQAVTVQDLDTDAVGVALNSAISSLQSEFSRFVVNMSWSIVPCNLGEDYNANKEAFPTLNEYLGELVVREGNSELLQGVCEALVNFLPEDLAESFQCTDGDKQAIILAAIQANAHEFVDSLDLEVAPEITFVASSGNFGLQFPTIPGAWDNVVSASASEPSNRRAKAEWSNEGEVMTLGGWVRLFGNPGAESLAVAGTSFSAPAVSVLYAIDLKAPTPFCVDATGFPDLAHFPFDGLYDDIELHLALNNYCIRPF